MSTSNESSPAKYCAAGLVIGLAAFLAFMLTRERADAPLKVGTCLEVCKYTAKSGKFDLDDIHPSTRLSELTRGPLLYGFYLMGLEAHFDVDILSNCDELIGNSGRTSAFGKCTMKDFADAIDRLKAKKRPKQ